jgi:copper chaperone
MATQIFTVAGMTCGHCAQAVAAEVGKLRGVVDVRVDLAAGTVTVISAEPLAVSDVATAVAEAGYEIPS